MIVEEATQDRPQPFTLLWYRAVPVAVELLTNFPQLLTYSLTNALSFDNETFAVPLAATIVREAEEVESLRFALSLCASVSGCESAKLYQTRFVRVQGKSEFVHAIPHIIQESLGIAVMLKAHHKLIRIPYDYYITVGLGLTPVLYPQVQNIMKIDIRQQWRYYCSLWRTFVSPDFPATFHHADTQPFVYQA